MVKAEKKQYQNLNYQIPDPIFLHVYDLKNAKAEGG